MEFIDGTHVPLRAQNSTSRRDPIDDLANNILPLLRRNLIEAGFDGLVWQAGLGNPVAGGNFMIERGTGRPKWVWVDLESGVPALFPINPLTLAGFYIPRSIHHGRPLFDDVDVPTLRRYVANHRGRIDARLGDGSVTELERHVAELERHQTAWKSMTRLDRGIAYFRAKGTITEADVQWYRERPCRWHLRLALRGVQSAGSSALWGIRRAARWIGQLDVVSLARTVKRLVVSQQFRTRIARRYLVRRMRDWADRRFLTPRQSQRLCCELRSRKDSETLADFGVHLAIKPLVKLVQWCVLPVLCVTGVLAVPACLAILAALGATMRTLYTAGRCVQAAWCGDRPPWVALAVGLLPGLGNAAFPAQLVHDARRTDAHLPQFILYDTFARIGHAVPIWGGANSLIEGRMNRLADFFTRPAPRPQPAIVRRTTALEEAS
jgi:hypothetical protein